MRRCWAKTFIERLQSGNVAEFRPKGGSMVPLIRSGQLCRVEPVDPATLQVNDIILCRVRGTAYLHLVKQMKEGRYLIGNNRGGINGWISGEQVFGRLVDVRE